MHVNFLIERSYHWLGCILCGSSRSECILEPLCSINKDPIGFEPPIIMHKTTKLNVNEVKKLVWMILLIRTMYVMSLCFVCVAQFTDIERRRWGTSANLHHWKYGELYSELFSTTYTDESSIFKLTHYFNVWYVYNVISIGLLLWKKEHMSLFQFYFYRNWSKSRKSVDIMFGGTNSFKLSLWI